MVFLDVSASLSLKLHNKSLYSVSLVTAHLTVAFLREPRHRSPSVSFDCSTVLITVDDACSVHALLLLLVPVPCIAVVGTSIVIPACYGANIVAHVFAGVFPLWTRLLTLPLLLTFFALPYLIFSRISVSCLICCYTHRVSVFCLTYCYAHMVSVLYLTYCRAHRVSLFYYVPYFLGFAVVFPLRTLL
ncbi:hypothetical protein L3X38_010368 [Prunus dulcis]|uniref:Uncharacterized protein n=1 Tax=Prunus dulcis TaxID=3755 RepID=A0AAD4WG84_PRUDU|nr:hypothetical protein L3X38_010368 [Prunus dulcis]